MQTKTATRTSFSRLSSWLRCPRLHRYRYIDLATEERVSGSMLLGIAFHEAAELHFRGIQRGEQFVSAEVYAAFDRALTDSAKYNEEVGCPVDYGKASLDELIGKGHEMLAVFLAESPRDIEVLDIERSFEIEIEPGRVVEGVLDLVLRQGNRVLVVDLKTSAQAFGQDRLDFDSQATTYIVAARQLYRCAVDFEFWLVTRTKSPRFIRYPVVRDAADEAELIEAIREVEAATALGVFPRRRDWQCMGCEYRDRCNGERGKEA
ncbi:MAG: PD-(D/E)XK nuclease family protein [Planctomycetes bacterium]|nr:PD-(D/E)XK nuclease family protein [Planctomycetota bacterium]